MGNARNLAKLVVDANGDVAAASLDNVPPSDDASALTTGTLPIARIADGDITAAKLASGAAATNLGTGNVTAAMLAGTLDLTGKTVTLPTGVGGKVANVGTFINSTRSALPVTSGGARVVMWSFTYDKILANSTLICFGQLAGKETASGAVQMFGKYGSSSELYSIHYTYEGTTWLHQSNFAFAFSGYTTTGTQTFQLGYFANNSGSGERPFGVLNPNSSDDNRLNQSASSAIILEVV